VDSSAGHTLAVQGYDTISWGILQGILRNFSVFFGGAALFCGTWENIFFEGVNLYISGKDS
jgi:hypothetical protein